MKNKKQKLSIIVLLFLYLAASQIYPFIHFHGHDHLGKTEFEICIHPADQTFHTHQCCDLHESDHSHFKGEWKFVELKIRKLTKQKSLSLTVYPEIPHYIFQTDYFLRNALIAYNPSTLSFNLFNKPPPQTI